MAEIAGRMILAIVETLTELFCVAVGRHILQFCGVRNSSHLASFFRRIDHLAATCLRPCDHRAFLN